MTVGAAEWVRDASLHGLTRFGGVILETVYISFSSSRSLKFHVCFGLVSRSFVYRFLNRYFEALDFEIVVFSLEVFQKTTFHGTRF